MNKKRYLGLQFNVVSAGHEFTCGVATDDEAYCWGENGVGQLGNGNTDEVATPEPVSGGLKFDSVSSGYLHSCGVTTNGLAYCWGDNEEGQLGDRSTNPSLVPVKVRLFQ